MCIFAIQKSTKTNKIKYIAMKHNYEISAYKITWIELRATDGVASIADKNKLKKLWSISNDKTSLLKHFGCKENAIAEIERIKKISLRKQYEVRLFTDKQFGMAKCDDGYKIPFTKKQNDDMFII